MHEDGDDDVTLESNEDEQDDDVIEDRHGVITREDEDEDDWEWEDSSPGLARPSISKSI